MMLKVFAIYDSKTNAFFPPNYMKTIGEMERALTGHINDPQHNFCKYSEDFTLFELGSWDDQTGKFTLLPTPHSIALFVQYKRPASSGEAELHH